MVHVNFGTLIPLIMAILSFGLGCVSLVLSWQRKRKESVTSRWLPAQGIVLSSEVKEYRSSGTEGTIQTAFAPLVRYQYTCNGHTYPGIRITISAGNFSRLKAEQIAARYPVGHTITAFYDPLHPEEAVLEKETSHTQTLKIAGLILLALGIGSFCITTLVFWSEKTFH